MFTDTKLHLQIKSLWKVSLLFSSAKSFPISFTDGHYIIITKAPNLNQQHFIEVKCFVDNLFVSLKVSSIDT